MPFSNLADLPMPSCGFLVPSHPTSPLLLLRAAQLRPSEAGRFFIMHWYSWTQTLTTVILSSQEVTKDVSRAPREPALCW
jgi:hypothetical protein